jgi:hypothetical protein
MGGAAGPHIPSTYGNKPLLLFSLPFAPTSSRRSPMVCQITGNARYALGVHVLPSAEWNPTPIKGDLTGDDRGKLKCQYYRVLHERDPRKLLSGKVRYKTQLRWSQLMQIKIFCQLVVAVHHHAFSFCFLFMFSTA